MKKHFPPFPPLIRRTTLLFTFSLFLLFTLPACKPDPNEEYLQGIWEFANEAGDERSGRVHLFFRWEFSGGIFYVQQEITMGKPLTSQGHYRILESDEDLIVLELYDIQGNYIQSEPFELRIELDKENATARIQKTLFNRIWP